MQEHKPRNKFFPWKFIVAIVLAAMLIVLAFEFYRLYFVDIEAPADIPKVVTPKTETKPDTVTDTPSANVETPLPAEAFVKVPFTTQAPFANWDADHEEACEEASLIMVYHFEKGSTIASKDQAESEILDLIDYQNQNGYKVDVTVVELNQIAKGKYGLNNGRVKKGASVNDIKKELASGRPVIVPAAGKILPNPNFRNGGPNYHMLVVVGYDNNGFITNDPGTRKGENFRYTFDALYNAMHDWNSSDILQGGKNYLVFD